MTIMHTIRYPKHQVTRLMTISRSAEQHRRSFQYLQHRRPEPGLYAYKVSPVQLNLTSNDARLSRNYVVKSPYTGFSFLPSGISFCEFLPLPEIEFFLNMPGASAFDQFTVNLYPLPRSGVFLGMLDIRIVPNLYPDFMQEIESEGLTTSEEIDKYFHELCFTPINNAVKAIGLSYFRGHDGVLTAVQAEMHAHIRHHWQSYVKPTYYAKVRKNNHAIS